MKKTIALLIVAILTVSIVAIGLAGRNEDCPVYRQCLTHKGSISNLRNVYSNSNGVTHHLLQEYDWQCSGCSEHGHRIAIDRDEPCYYYTRYQAISPHLTYVYEQCSCGARRNGHTVHY